MKPNSSNPNPQRPHVHLGLEPEAGVEMNQTLTFQTVEDLLSFDRSEIEVPDGVTRRLKLSLPSPDVKLGPPASGKPWKPRGKE